MTKLDDESMKWLVETITTNLEIHLQPERAFGVNQLCNMLNISKPSLYGEINSGRLVTYQVGRRRLATRESVRKWQKDRECEGFTL